MNLAELKNRCQEQGFNYAYGVFKTPVEPPHLVAICRNTDNFMADNRVYEKDLAVQLDYTYIDKNLEEQNKIEDIILADIPWNKTDEVYLSDEKIWQVSYFFELDNKQNEGSV